MLSQWQFGYAAIIGGIIFPVVYLLIRQLRRFGAWVNRDEAPKERTRVYIIALVILGFFVGGLCQGLIEIGVACSKQGKPVIGCTIDKMIESGFKAK